MHAHADPIILYACSAHVQCQGHGIRHNKSSWIRVKEQQGAKSAGGLKVKALSLTPRDAGSSPAQHSTFPALNNCFKRKLFIINSYKAVENCIW